MDIQKIRSDFPILQQKIHGHPLVYLDNSATTQKPQQVIDSIIRFYTSVNANVHRSGHFLSEQASVSFESTRQKVKSFIHAKQTEEIIFTSGTTESINLVAQSFKNQFIKSDDEIIISEMEHHSNIVPWQQICKQKNARLKIIPFNEHGELIIDTFKKLITEKTKLIALTFVSNALGTINPVKEIIHIAHEKNIPVLIDGAQAVQHLPVDVQDLDCDFFVFSGHKMYAGTGVGILYAKQKWLEKMQPYTYGGGMVESVSFENTTFANHPFKFEAGTSNISGILSLGKAIDYLNNIGINKIQQHEQRLVTYSLDQLSTLDGLTIYAKPKKRCGIISFNLEDIHHYDAMMILDKLGVAVRSGKHCAEPVMTHYNIKGTIRVSFAMYNTTEEIDRLLVGLQKVQEMHR
ncbi:MAG TPA: cysteine desulfurase [Candidatus Thermoplasmatota archaeon]|nr:cysteine desulfurase [Candidatus Thermoplasmatota archaeon]